MVYNRVKMLIRKFATASSIAIGLLLLANTAVAVSPVLREAIGGLPIADQISFIATEVDKIKVRQDKAEACAEADSFLEGGYIKFENLNFSTVEQALEIAPRAIGESHRRSKFFAMIEEYQAAK